MALTGDDLWLPRAASMIKFREIREKIADVLNIDESAIRPETRLAAIVPPGRRNEVIHLITESDVPSWSRVYPIRSPGWVVELVASTLLSVLCLFQPWFLVILTLPLTVLIANLFRRSSSSYWPHCFETMHELAISQTHYNKDDAARGLWPHEEISAKVRWIVARQLGYRFEEITEETDFLDLI